MKNLEASQFAEYTAAQRNLDTVCREINLKARRIIRELKPEEDYYSELVGRDGTVTDAGWAFVNSFTPSQNMNRLLGRRDELRSLITDMEKKISFLETDIRLWEAGEYRFLSPEAYDMALFALITFARPNGMAPKSVSVAVSNRLGHSVDGMATPVRDYVWNSKFHVLLNVSRTIVCSVDSDVPEIGDMFDENYRSEIVQIATSNRWIINDACDEMFYEVIPCEHGFIVLFSRKGCYPLFMAVDENGRIGSLALSVVIWLSYGRGDATLNEAEAEGFDNIANKVIARLFSIFDMYRKGDQVEYVQSQTEAKVCSGVQHRTSVNPVSRIHVVRRTEERKYTVRYIVSGHSDAGSTDRVFVMEEWHRKEYVRMSKNGKKVVIPAVICRRRQDLLSKVHPRRQESTVKRVRLME